MTPNPAGATTDLAGEAPLPGPARLAATVSVLSAMALVVLDAGMVNVALPTMATALETSPAGAVLIVTSYQAALLMALMPAAAFGERLGNALVFRAGVAVFLAGAILSALAPSLPWLLAARLVQGIGGAAVMALGVSLLRSAVGTARLGEAVGWNALAVALASAAAPTLGSLLIEGFDRRWMFLAAAPTAMAALLASCFLPATPRGPTPVDLGSVALNALAFGLVVIAVEALPRSAVAAVLLFMAAAAAMRLLVRREAGKAAPLVPLDLLADKGFRLSVVASVLCFTGQAAGMVAIPFYLQQGLGLTTLEVGLYLLPWPIGVAAAAAWVGRLSDRALMERFCAAGSWILATGLFAIALWPFSREEAWPLFGFTALCGVGFGLFQVPNNRNLFQAAGSGRSGAAGGAQGAARLTGQMSGALLMTLLFNLAPPALVPRTGLAIGAAFAIASVLATLARTSRQERESHHAV